MKKQLLLALMLFAFLFPCEIAEAKDTRLNSLQQQATTGQLLLARWGLTPRRQNQRRIGKRRGIKRLNFRRFTQRRSVKKRSRVRINFRRFSLPKLIQRRVRKDKR
ncbi:MAG: hypothetical protein ACR2LR_23050 [Hassallia sp.]